MLQPILFTLYGGVGTLRFRSTVSRTTIIHRDLLHSLRCLYLGFGLPEASGLYLAHIFLIDLVLFSVSVFGSRSCQPSSILQLRKDSAR
jgi:hypothetical protein